MGNPSHPLLDTLKEIIQGSQGDRMMRKPSSSTSWEEVLEAKGKGKSSQVAMKKAKASSKNGGHLIWSRRSRRILMKRRAPRLEGNSKRMARDGIKSRVRTLKKLVPNTESMGLDVLFTETADYIMSLQMRVRVMQIMVQVLSASNRVN